MCCGAKGCPDIKLTEDGERVQIRFDDGAVGEMLVTQAELIAPALQHLTEDSKERLDRVRQSLGPSNITISQEPITLDENLSS